MKHRYPIIEPCSAHNMFARLAELNIGRCESNAGWDVILLPANVALVQESGGVLWRRLMRGKLPEFSGYILAAPVNAFQRQQQRGLGPLNWIVLVEAPQEPTP